MNLETIPAPAGWGHRPGANLLGGSRAELPDLPMLKLIKPGTPVSPIIIEAILSVDGLLPTLKARDLMDAYGVGRSLAHDILNKADMRRG